jgi:hypothetical protein
MSPAARRPVSHRRCRRRDQLQHVWSVGPDEPDADRIEDEDARRANSRLGQVFEPRPAYVLGEETYCIAHRLAPTLQLSIRILLGPVPNNLQSRSDPYILLAKHVVQKFLEIADAPWPSNDPQV